MNWLLSVHGIWRLKVTKKDYCHTTGNHVLCHDHSQKLVWRPLIIFPQTSQTQILTVQICPYHWSSLLTFLFSRNHLAWVQEEWNSRKNWWPIFHFSYFWAKSDWKEDRELACEKAFVAGILLGKGTCFCFLFLSWHRFWLILKLQSMTIHSS
jgi:hypothetical protein